MIKQLIVGGTDLSMYVVRWSDIELVKELLLAKATLFTGSYELELENSNGRFSPDKTGSMFRGRSFYNVPAQVLVDGIVIFNGLLKDISPSHDPRLATFEFEDVLSQPSETKLVAQTSIGVNPVYAILGFFSQIFPDPGTLARYVDVQSFQAAAGPTLDAKATVDINIAGTSNASVLALTQTLSDLASVSIFSRNGLVTARAWQPYQGEESGLRSVIGPAQARKFISRKGAYTSFINQVSIPYGTSSVLTRNDTQSQDLTGVTKAYQFNTATGSEVAVPDFVSAQYYASLFLARSSSIPVTADVELGKEFFNVNLGDRFPLTATHWGFERAPFEVIESHRSLEQQSISLTLRAL